MLTMQFPYGFTMNPLCITKYYQFVGNHTFMCTSNTRQSLDSDPFFTSSNGYIAALSVYPNAKGSGSKGTRVFIYLMKGPNKPACHSLMVFSQCKY